MNAGSVSRTSHADARRRADAGLERLRSALARGWLQRLWYGVGLPFEGALFIARHPRLWVWAAVPGVLIALGIALAAFVFFATLAGAISSSDGFSGFAALFVGALVAVGVVQATLLLFIPAAGPFMEFLVESTEDIEGRRLWEHYAPVKFSFGVFSRNLLITFVHWLLFAGLTWFVGATVSCLPVVGWLLATYLLSLALAWSATGNDIGTVRLWSFADKMAVIWGHGSILSGTALVYSLIVPVLGPLGLMFLHPSCGVGWTLTLLRLEKLQTSLPPDRRRELLGLGAGSVATQPLTQQPSGQSGAGVSPRLSPLLLGGGIAAAVVGALGIVVVLGFATLVAVAGSNTQAGDETNAHETSRPELQAETPDAAAPSTAATGDSSVVLNRLGLAELTWAQTPTQTTLPLEIRSVEGCAASYLSVARLDTPAGAPVPGGVALSFHRGSGLFEVVLRSDLSEEAVGAYLREQFGEPVADADVQRWDVSAESVTVTRARGRTAVRVWHRARQRHYTTDVAACE